MITIISGTNRVGNNTKKIALIYQQILAHLKVENKLLALDEVNVYERNEAFVNMETSFLQPADKFIFVLPEYNGSYPGILKLMIDNSDVKTCWPNKKALLVGVATGRAGNLRGMEHFTGALLHLQMNVHYNRLPISTVHQLLNSKGDINDEATLKNINKQISEFIHF